MAEMYRLQLLANQRQAYITEHYKAFQNGIDQSLEAWVSVAIVGIGSKPMFFGLAILLAFNPHRHPKFSVYLIIDEFQRIVGENIKIILQQARSSRIATVLANQTIADLVTPSADLRPLLQSCTRFRQAFSVSRSRSISSLSGLVLKPAPSQAQRCNR